MAAITCFAAGLNLVPSSPPIGDLTLQTKQLTDYFATAFQGTDLSLGVDWSRRGQFPNLVSAGGVADGDLDTALTALLGADVGNPACIGLLFADSYGPAPGQYGLMFDIAGQTGGFGPRQGCAVFVNAVFGALPQPPPDGLYQDFLTFIAIHEIGHAFNLWHMPGSGSFMEPSPVATALGSCAFDPCELRYLGLADDPATATFVLPGGAAFEKRPSGWPGPDGTQPFAGPPAQNPPVSLEIGLSHDVLWSFEPLELDLQLRLAGDGGGSATVPNELDPGYGSFQIWVTRPSGERFAFRSQTRCCGRNGDLEITPDRPFRRDIAIFRQSGGLTFDAPGVYEVQVVFRLQDGTLLRSNVARCEVLPAAPGRLAWAEANSVLSTQEAQRFLKWKRRLPPHYDYTRLTDLAARMPPGATVAAIHYALGRALAGVATDGPDAGFRALMRSRAEGHLQRAVNSQALSQHRAAKVESLLEGLRET